MKYEKQDFQEELQSILNKLEKILSKLNGSYTEKEYKEAVEYSIATYRAGTLVRLIGENFRPIAESRNQELKMEIAPDDVSVAINSSRFEKTIRSLLMNATYSSPDGGLILLKTEVIGNHYTILVEDSGKGVSRHDVIAHLRGTLNEKTDVPGPDESDNAIELSTHLSSTSDGVVAINQSASGGLQFVYSIQCFAR